MNIKCFMVEADPDGGWKNSLTGDIKSNPAAFGPGAMWRAPYPKNGPLEIWVVLPGNAGRFCLASKPTDGGTGWAQSGEPPLITLTPSVNVVGIWHGWLRSGELVDE